MDLGVISDTHGLLRPEALAALRGCDQIIHAGDIGREGLLDELGNIAPTSAIRGNVDRDAWAATLPDELRLSFAGANVCVIHDLNGLPFDPAPVGIDLIISGHSHRPSFEQRNGVWCLNPGSAGKRRFSLPVTLARVQITAGGEIRAQLVDLLKQPPDQ